MESQRCIGFCEEQEKSLQVLTFMEIVSHEKSPNEGFLEQLKLYQESGFNANISNPKYQRCILKYRMNRNFGNIPVKMGSSHQSSTEIDVVPPFDSLKCKKCR